MVEKYICRRGRDDVLYEMGTKLVGQFFCSCLAIRLYPKVFPVQELFSTVFRNETISLTAENKKAPLPVARDNSEAIYVFAEQHDNLDIIWGVTVSACHNHSKPFYWLEWGQDCAHVRCRCASLLVHSAVVQDLINIFERAGNFFHALVIHIFSSMSQKLVDWCFQSDFIDYRHCERRHHCKMQSICWYKQVYIWSGLGDLDQLQFCAISCLFHAR